MTYSALIRFASTGTTNSINNILTTSCRHRSLLLSSITGRTTTMTTITTIRNYAPSKSRLCLFEANRRDSHLLANDNNNISSIWRKAEPRRFQSSKADEKSTKSVPKDQQVSVKIFLIIFFYLFVFCCCNKLLKVTVKFSVRID